MHATVDYTFEREWLYRWHAALYRVMVTIKHPEEKRQAYSDLIGWASR